LPIPPDGTPGTGCDDVNGAAVIAPAGAFGAICGGGVPGDEPYIPAGAGGGVRRYAGGVFPLPLGAIAVAITPNGAFMFDCGPRPGVSPAATMSASACSLTDW
jgi:hypothetical protein